jgi:hypothetical protein
MGPLMFMIFQWIFPVEWLNHVHIDAKWLRFVFEAHFPALLV